MNEPKRAYKLKHRELTDRERLLQHHAVDTANRNEEEARRRKESDERMECEQEDRKKFHAIRLAAAEKQYNGCEVLRGCQPQDPTDWFILVQDQFRSIAGKMPLTLREQIVHGRIVPVSDRRLHEVVINLYGLSIGSVARLT
jgi:hypothetical protein